MQVRIFTIPIIGGEALNEEMNVFLRSKKILQVESQIVQERSGAFWCFSVKYLEDQGREREKVDYKELLDEASFPGFGVALL